MTTNITPREAIKEMKTLFFSIKGCTHSSSLNPNKRAYKLAKEGQDIATQALAPQECDVSNTRLPKGMSCKHGTPCASYPEHCINCDELYSQEKTFTQYEVRDILNSVLLNYLDKPSVDAYRLDVLKQFEKAVG